MTRLETAKAEWVAALQEEQQLIGAELERLGAGPASTPFDPAPLTLGRISPRHPAPVRTQPHRKFAGGGKKAKPGTETCSVCGRDELFKAMGPNQKGLLKFHYCPGELACKGGSLSPATAEDLKAGTHEKGKCPKCAARVAYK